MCLPICPSAARALYAHTPSLAPPTMCIPPDALAGQQGCCCLQHPDDDQNRAAMSDDRSLKHAEEREIPVRTGEAAGVLARLKIPVSAHNQCSSPDRRYPMTAWSPCGRTALPHDAASAAGRCQPFAAGRSTRSIYKVIDTTGGLRPFAAVAPYSCQARGSRHPSDLCRGSFAAPPQVGSEPIVSNAAQQTSARSGLRPHEPPPCFNGYRYGSHCRSPKMTGRRGIRPTRSLSDSV